MYYNGRWYTRSDLTEAWYDSDNMRVPLGLQHTLEALYKKDLIVEKEHSSLMLPGAEESGASIKRIATDNLNNKLNITSKDGIVQFGCYSQGQNGEVLPIRWRVLNEDDDKMLLIADECLDSFPLFLEKNTPEVYDWYSSYVRAWLNTEFLMNAFSDDERDLILRVKPKYEKCIDYVSLLSLHEIQFYLNFSKDKLKTTSTPWARGKGVGVKPPVNSAYWWEQNKTSPDDNNAYWWTRDVSKYGSQCIKPNGDLEKIDNVQKETISYSGQKIVVGLRPIILIRKNTLCSAKDVESCIFYKTDRKNQKTEKETLYIYKGNIRCRRYAHEVIQATAIMRGTADNEIKMNVEYCTDCNKFILNYTSYQEYRNKYGVIIGNVRMVTNDLFDGAYDLAEESPLKLSGYNVGQQDDFDSSTRHYILASIIYDNIMTKGEVIGYLQHFIHLNGSKRSNWLAVQKWKEDLEFVQNYNIDDQPRVAVSCVKPYSSKRYN